MDPPYAINQNTPIREAVKQLINLKLNGCPVVDDNQLLVGFVSEQDCIKDMLNEVFYCEDSISVKNVMTSQVFSVSPDSSIVEVAELMSSKPPKSYPVVLNNRLIGVISRASVLEALLESCEDCYLHIS